MATYDSEKVILKNNKEVVIRICKPCDAEKYPMFSEMISLESTHTFPKDNSIENRIDKGKAEGINNKIKVLKR